MMWYVWMNILMFAGWLETPIWNSSDTSNVWMKDDDRGKTKPTEIKEEKWK